MASKSSGTLQATNIWNGMISRTMPQRFVTNLPSSSAWRPGFLLVKTGFFIFDLKAFVRRLSWARWDKNWRFLDNWEFFEAFLSLQLLGDRMFTKFYKLSIQYNLSFVWRLKPGTQELEKTEQSLKEKDPTPAGSALAHVVCQPKKIILFFFCNVTAGMSCKHKKGSSIASGWRDMMWLPTAMSCSVARLVETEQMLERASVEKSQAEGRAFRGLAIFFFWMLVGWFCWKIWVCLDMFTSGNDFLGPLVAGRSSKGKDLGRDFGHRPKDQPATEGKEEQIGSAD